MTRKQPKPLSERVADAVIVLWAAALAIVLARAVSALKRKGGH